jgi:hypothetical protein
MKLASALCMIVGVILLVISADLVLNIGAPFIVVWLSQLLTCFGTIAILVSMVVWSRS